MARKKPILLRFSAEEIEAILALKNIALEERGPITIPEPSRKAAVARQLRLCKCRWALHDSDDPEYTESAKIAFGGEIVIRPSDHERWNVILRKRDTSTLAAALRAQGVQLPWEIPFEYASEEEVDACLSTVAAELSKHPSGLPPQTLKELSTSPGSMHETFPISVYEKAISKGIDSGILTINGDNIGAAK